VQFNVLGEKTEAQNIVK